MSLSLPPPSAAYDAGNEAETRRKIEGADKMNVKKGVPDSLRSPNGKQWLPTIDNSGVVTWTAVTV